MIGDCQVISSKGENVVSSEALFSSAFQSPNLNFLPFEPLMIPKEENGLFLRGKEDMESGSGSELKLKTSLGMKRIAVSSSSRKNVTLDTLLVRYNNCKRISTVFKECPHPDDKQRTRLGQELGLKPRQVKFWFQNCRTQMKMKMKQLYFHLPLWSFSTHTEKLNPKSEKTSSNPKVKPKDEIFLNLGSLQLQNAQQDRSEIAILRAENESLQNEFYCLQAELSKLICPNCDGPPVPGGRIMNARLAEELERVFAIASRYMGHSIKLWLRILLRCRGCGCYGRHADKWKTI
ncbi:Homeobox-leucine zipper protein HDG5 isoform 2 [Hibiscus syriacus]|uniref:Homeobox-leucine zipper protein HDG5 isoform 2 n=1 Tax=Hibiscus syriacus TaxID=106335 RepID=A0A6A3CHA9_HIBSY|nr:Homeobox-leucine zipper protein HDG5 isoform 2 [Hibiscus syriacus]